MDPVTTAITATIAALVFFITWGAGHGEFTTGIATSFAEYDIEGTI
jgi:hypothetical protein